jgi:hypothetical protein
MIVFLFAYNQGAYYVLDDIPTTQLKDALEIASIDIFIKEYLFIGLIFYEVAKVNHLVDELTFKLIKTKWNQGSVRDIEINRIISLCQIEPISFRLMGCQLRLRDLFYQLLGVMVSTTVGIVRAFIIV